MIQRTFERVRRIELQLGVEPSHYEPGQEPPKGQPPRFGREHPGEQEGQEVIRL
jgi:hypothetical protein